MLHNYSIVVEPVRLCCDTDVDGYFMTVKSG